MFLERISGSSLDFVQIEFRVKSEPQLVHMDPRHYESADSICSSFGTFKPNRITSGALGMILYVNLSPKTFMPLLGRVVLAT